VDIYHAVINWGRVNTNTEDQESNEALKEGVKDVLNYVRFPRMRPTDIRDIIEPDGIVPLHLILEAYRISAIAEEELSQVDRESPRIKSRKGGKTKFSFDPKKCARGITLSDHNKSVSNGPSIMCQTVLGNKGFREGKHYWECKIEQTAVVSDIMIGIVDNFADLNDFLSHTRNGFALYGNNGHKYHNRKGLPFAKMGFRTGDSVGVLVDFTKDSISFFMNGKPITDTYAYTKITEGLGKNDKFYPAVTLYAPNDKVTLNTKAAFPKFNLKVDSTACD